MKNYNAKFPLIFEINLYLQSLEQERNKFLICDNNFQ